jgi:Predicted exporters of the RND superfamily
MEQFYRLIVYHPKSVLLILILLSGFFAYHARHIRYDTSVESLLPDDDPENQYYRESRALFGSDEVGVIGIVADDIYTPEILTKNTASHKRNRKD